MRRVLFCLLAWVVFGPALADAQLGATVELAPCTLTAAHGLLSQEADCGYLAVAENPAAPAGKQIKLHIAIVRARTAEAAPDPMFFIAGGPGQSASEGFLALRGAFQAVLAERDIVLLDQRGTGQSNPLTCPPPENAPLWPDAATQLALLKQCLAELPGDPRYYTTSIAVDDLDRVRAALGYEQINLYGISYGTRVAQQYLREYEAHVHSVVLDGVVPAAEVLGASMALDAQRALDLMLARCAASADCATAFPGLRTDYATLLRRLQQQAVPVSLRDPLSGAPLDIRFGHEQLVQALRLLSYGTETVALLPLLLHSAAQGDLEPLAAQAVLTGQALEGALAIGMHNAIVCTEDVPFYQPTAAQHAALAETYMGSLQVELLQTMCGFWPRGVLAEDFKQPVVSDKPVLLLSGEVDPVTPPANAEQVAATLGNSRQIVAPGQGHGIANRGCMPRVLADFYASATPGELETDCVAELEPAPFFVRFTGPNP